ncbi:hypothetical protein KM043_006374 [Ampulex compressa]|nr:hypothetical protein KM043_006374 [Ampulex compressa]
MKNVRVADLDPEGRKEGLNVIARAQPRQEGKRSREKFLRETKLGERGGRRGGRDGRGVSSPPDSETRLPTSQNPRLASSSSPGPPRAPPFSSRRTTMVKRKAAERRELSAHCWKTLLVK